MRIISKFRDYYDCVQAHGQDRGLKYVRNEDEEKIGYRWPFPSVMTFNSNPTWLKQNIIGFCGKLYPCLHVAYTNYELARHSCREHATWKTEEYPTAFCFTLDEVDEFVNANYKKRDIEVYYEGKKHDYWRRSGVRQLHLKEFFEKMEQEADKHQKRFEEHLSPIFVASLVGSVHRAWEPATTKYEQKIDWNASLREFEFMRIKDPYTAYQELSMYLGNMAFPNKPIPKIDDKTMAEIKGFDKFSFRKDKAS